MLCFIFPQEIRATVNCQVLYNSPRTLFPSRNGSADVHAIFYNKHSLFSRSQYCN